MAWVCDFTYIRSGSRFYYLCAIMDLFSCKIIAFRLYARINTDLAIATLEDAIRVRGVSFSVMFHTDRSSQFTAKRFRQYLDQHNMIQSFSAEGYPYDNAVMECFSDISSMGKRIDVLIAHYQSYRTLCSVTSMVSTIPCVHILITMNYHPLLLKLSLLSSPLFIVYFIDNGSVLADELGEILHILFSTVIRLNDIDTPFCKLFNVVVVVPFQPVQIHEVVPHLRVSFFEFLKQRSAELAEITDNGRTLVGIQFFQRVVAFSVKALLDDVLLHADEIGYGCDEFFGINGHGIASVI